MWKLAGNLLLLGTMAGTLFAQAPSPPACEASEYRAMDFWVGEWDVFRGDSLVGESRITKEAQGCLVVEQWFGTDGDRGISLNYYHPSEKRWLQHYVGAGWNVDYAGKASSAGIDYEGNGMRPDGKRPVWRLHFEKRGDGSVRQWKEEASGESWEPIYDFTYRKRTQPITARENASERCTDSLHRQFQFWKGKWNVTSGAKAAGTNEILPRANGCVLYENWRSASGGEGKSINFVDAVSGKWRQVWVSPGAYLNLTGEWREAALRYRGDYTSARSGGAVKNQLDFTPNADGTVRQFWRQSVDGGKTWTVAFDGLYTRAQQ